VARKTMCGTPRQFCCGSVVKANKSLGGGVSAHPTPEEAFKCYAQYLIKIGYIQVGNREFASPNDGPILLLTKKCRFGAPLRPGKSVKGQASTVFIPYAGKRPKPGTIVG
jgi:hypothetical protein